MTVFVPQTANGEQLPPPRPAANERSPNRKPRWRSVIRRWSEKKAREMWLEVYRNTGGNVALACAAVQRTQETVAQWVKKYPDFAAGLENAQKVLTALYGDAIEDMTPAALRVYRETLEEGEDAKLRLQAARDVLRSKGVITDRTEQRVEVTGEGGGPVKIHTIEVRTDASGDGDE